jgi:hypothetical protein
MESFTPASIVLSILFAISVVLTFSRSRVPNAQLLHFLEEAVYDLHVRLPEVFGLPAMKHSLFLAINIGVLIVWLFGAFQRTANAIVISTFWFLALASVFNLLAHPTMTLVTGRYFPGVVTSPVVGVTGVLLLRRLLQVTRADLASGTAA